MQSLVGRADEDDKNCRGEVNVRLKRGKDINKVLARHRSYIKDVAGDDQYLLGLSSEAELEEGVERLEADDDVEFASANRLMQLPEVRQVSQAFIDPAGPPFIDGQSPGSFFNQPSLGKLRLAQAQAISRGNNMRVAVIDTGLDLTHPLFAGRVIGPMYDFVDNDGSPADSLSGVGAGHGTFVAGIIALAAPDAMIMPLRAFDRDGVGTSYNIARAIRFAADNGARVINLSFGLVKKDKTIKDALDYAYNRAVIIAAAGNGNMRRIEYPAEQRDRAVSVTSTNANDRKAPFANYDDKIDVSAPGDMLYSAYPGGRWAWWSGTSFSTAFVSGEAAVLLALDPDLKIDKVRKYIIDTGVKIDDLNQGYRNRLGRRIDFRSAIDDLLKIK